MISLIQAVRALNQRKQILMDNHGDWAGTGVVGDDEAMRLLLVGMDLGIDELGEISSEVLSHYLQSMAAGVVPAEEALNGLWIDGVLTGIMLQELRQQEATSGKSKGTNS